MSYVSTASCAINLTLISSNSSAAIITLCYTILDRGTENVRVYIYLRLLKVAIKKELAYEALFAL